MRIRAYSALHLEFGPFDAPALDDVDVVVLAGDIDVKGRGVTFAKRFPWVDGFKPDMTLEVGR